MDSDLTKALRSGDVAALERLGCTVNWKVDAMTTKAKRSKYGAVKTEIDGHVFDSKKEARRYLELKAMLPSREIGGLVLQPEYRLVVNGILVCKYVADFEYRRGKEIIVEDVKGMKTPVYRLKKKLMAACLGIEITEV